MRKNFLKLFAFFSILSMPLFAAGKTVSVTTEVQSIDKHGNLNLAITSSTLATKGFSVTDIVTVKVESAKFTAPVVNDYTDVESGSYLVRVNGQEVSIAINSGNISSMIGAKIGSKVTITQKEHYGYLTTFHLRLLKKDDDRKHFSSDEVFANFREVKNNNIASGRLYRFYNPLENNPRAQYASSLMEAKGVQVIINVANTIEDMVTTYPMTTYYKNLAENSKVCFLNMGSSFTDESFNEKLKDALTFIADNPCEVYGIHGKESKNRVGYVVAILQAITGSTIDEIINEYMLSFENLYGVQKNRAQYDELAKSVKYMFANINGGKMPNDKNLQKVVEKYLLKNVGLSAAKLEALKANLD